MFDLVLYIIGADMRETRQDLGADPMLAICESIAMGYKVQPEGRPQDRRVPTLALSDGVC